MRILSWILLTLVMALTILAGLGSVTIAYFGDPSGDLIVGSTTLQSLDIQDEVKDALRGRRGTAAAFALGYSCLMLFVILGPYRKGAKWAWWAILVSSVVTGGVMLLRIIPLGIMQGASVGGIMLLVVIPALLLDSKRLMKNVEEETDEEASD